MEEFVRDEDILELSEEQRNKQLLQSILRAQRDLKQSHMNFEFAEKELIDFYSYQIKANQSKLDYLTKLAKSLNLKY